jgi:hypothetical protein
MHRLAIAGFFLVLSVSGCAWMKGTATSEGRRDAQVPVPPNAAPQTTPPPASTPPTAVATPPSPAATVPTEAGSSTDNGSQRSSTPAKASEAAQPPPPPTPPVNPASHPSSAKARSSGDTGPAKVAGAAAAQTRQSVSSPTPLSSSSPAPAPASKPNASPTLNLADLEQRLRETRAIGVFTKLSLKNQVDDLLNAFRELYRGPDKHPSAELRQRYDLLLLKVLTLLQDGDPPLAAAISSSREAIWSILADPDKFAKI